MGGGFPTVFLGLWVAGCRSLKGRGSLGEGGSQAEEVQSELPLFFGQQWRTSWVASVGPLSFLNGGGVCRSAFEAVNQKQVCNQENRGLAWCLPTFFLLTETFQVLDRWGVCVSAERKLPNTARGARVAAKRGV